MNAVAGGGSFLTLPALILAGLPPVAANASSTVALFPASLASTWAYHRDLASPGPVSLRALLPVSLAGGAVGAVLLLATPSTLFDALLPWLLLLATLSFAFGQQAGLALRRLLRIGPVPLLLVQFLLAVYGGYFGGAVGIMMMATWSLLSSAGDVKAMNPPKTLLVAATNAVAVLCFIAACQVWWKETLATLIAAVLGGYVGARMARCIEPRLLRRGVILLTAAMTLAFFLREPRAGP